MSVKGYKQLTISSKRQKELEEIIGIINKKENRYVTLNIGDYKLNAHFRRYDNGQLKLHFGPDSTEAIATLSDSCVGIKLDYIGDNTFEISVIDDLDEFADNIEDTISENKKEDVAKNDKTSTLCFDIDRFKDYLERKKSIFFSNLTQFASNEYNVKSQLIDPILDNLGWDFPNHRHYEVVCKGSYSNGCRADYALFRNGRYDFVIEAKAIDKDLSEYEYQINDYVSHTYKFKNTIGILTNGYEWRVYSIYNNVSKLLIRTDISKPDFIKFAKLISFNEKSIDEDTIKELSESKILIHNDCEYFFHPKNTTICVTYNGKQIKGNGTNVLHEFISELDEQDLEKLSKNGSFDRIVITKDTQNFQRALYDNCNGFYVTSDYAVSFKYLIIKQIINLLNLDAKVEYI